MMRDDQCVVDSCRQVLDVVEKEMIKENILLSDSEFLDFSFFSEIK